MINKRLLSHKDLGVQSLVACCLSDILRIYAPDAPYTDFQLADIFKLFIKQFRRLSEPENGYYSQQVYLITRSAEVRSIILVTDIDENSTLIESIFELFYDTNNKFHKKLEPIISDILIEIISEWDQISTSVLRLILNKFLTHGGRDPTSVESALANNSLASPFNFTLNICNANPDRLARYLTRFFSEVLFEHHDQADESPESFKSLIKLHKLTIEIWKYVPEILGSVMGLIDNELSADDVKIRLLATETVGKILSATSRLNFPHVHKQTWINWMKKTLDISPQVRSKWVESTGEILKQRNDITREIANGISKTLIDTDERVRLNTITTIRKVDPSVVLEKLGSKTILNALVQLTREKHSEVRNGAIKIIGSLLNEAYLEIYSTSGAEKLSETLTLVKSFPSQILNLYYINDKGINIQVDSTLFQEILPPISNGVERVERLLNIYSDLDSKAKASFLAFNKRQQELSRALGKYIDFSEELKGDENSDAATRAKLDKTISWLSVALPDELQPRESFWKFSKINNGRLYRLLKLIISPESNYETLQNSQKEFFKRLEDPKVLSSVKNSSVGSITPTFSLLVDRASQNVFNKSNIAPLLKLSTNELYSKAAQELIDNISTITPAAFENEISYLVNLVKESKPKDGPSKGNVLKALFHIFRRLTSYVDENDYEFFDKIAEFGKSGCPSEAKYAVKIISVLEKKDVLSDQLFSDIYPLNETSENLPAHLAVISQLFLTIHDIPEERANELTPFLIKNILLKNEVIGKDDDEAWVDDDDLENEANLPLTAKLFALKAFTNRLRSLADSDSEEITSIAEHVLKLFSSLIGNGGEIVNSRAETYPTPKHYQSRLRLAAGLNLLKLARFPRYNKLIKPALIDRLVLLVQDENEAVRSRFIHKVTDYLKKEEISLKFLPLVYLIAFEPAETLKNEIKTWIKSSFGRRVKLNNKNDVVFEKSLTGLVYLIAHHAEFLEYVTQGEENEDDLVKAYTFALEYVVFYLEAIANEKNISLLYYFANRVKQYRDSSFEDKDFDEGNDQVKNIYRVAELTQLAIKELQIHKGWTLQSYPAKIDLSSDLFKSMKSSREGQHILSTSFIPSDVLKRISILTKQKISHISSAKRSRPISEGSTSARKVKKQKAKKAKVYRRAATVESEEDGDTKYSSKANTPERPTRVSSRSKREVKYADLEHSDLEDNETEQEESEGEDE